MSAELTRTQHALPTFRDVYTGIVQHCPRARFPAVPSVPLGGHGPLRDDVALTPVVLRPSWSRELIDVAHRGACCAPHIPSVSAQRAIASTSSSERSQGRFGNSPLIPRTSRQNRSSARS